MKPKIKLPNKAKIRAIHNAKEVGIIAGGSLIGAAGYDGIRTGIEATRKKNTESPRTFNWKTNAKWVGTIAAGDVVGEGIHDSLKPKKKKREIQKTTAIPGNGPTTLSRLPLLTFFIAGPDPYSVKRRNLRGKKRPGVPKVAKFENEQRRTNLNPDKTEKFKNVATGVGALGGAAATGYAAHRVGRAAKTAEKLQKHVGGLAKSTHDKVNAHIDYIGHHAAEAAAEAKHTLKKAGDEAERTGRTARKTVAAYHPRSIIRAVGSKLKRIPAVMGFICGYRTTDLNAMKEKHPKGEERHPSWISRNGARIVGTTVGAVGTAAFLAKFRRPGSGSDITRGRGITKGRIVKKPGEMKIANKAPDPKITNIRKVKKGSKKTNLCHRQIVRHFDAQGRDTHGRMAPKSELIPSYRKARQIITPARRTGEVAQDLHDIARGKRDPKKKPFYEKAWFQGGALALAGAVGIRAHRKHAEKNGYHPYFSGRHPVTNLSAFMRDVKIHKLAESTQKDIAQVLPLKKGTKVAHYGMVPKELLSKADPHNLATARKHVSNMSPLRARRDVDGKPDKHILLLNDRIVDGHHHLAKAERAGISRSLPVLDLTPARFQLSAACARVTDLAFLIHDDSFPLLPQKQPKLPKGMKQRVPTAETKERVIARLKAQTQLSRREFGNGIGKIASEAIIDAASLGDATNPKKKKSKAKQAADDVDPDLTPTNNWTADVQAPLVKMFVSRRRILEFAGLPPGIPPTKPTPRTTDPKDVRIDDRKGLSTKNHGFDKFNRMHQRNGLSAIEKITSFGRTASELMKLRRVPYRMKKTGYGGEIRTAPTAKSVPDAKVREDRAGYHDDVHDARISVAREVKRQRKMKQEHRRETDLLSAHIPLINFALGATLEHPMVSFLGHQPIPGQKPVRLYNLKKDLGPHKKGSTVTHKTLANLGYTGFSAVRRGLVEFYGTSAGVTAAWDTRGRSRDRSANGSHWWTHSPTRNSVRVVRSPSEEGPRTRRGKKFHEKTSTHKAALAITTGAAAGLGVLAVNRHLKFKNLDKIVHRPGHSVTAINRKGQPPLYRADKHQKPAKTSEQMRDKKTVSKRANG